MKIIIEIPEEFRCDYDYDRFSDNFERIKFDIKNALDEVLSASEDTRVSMLSGNYEYEIVDMLIDKFAASTVIPDDATNGDMIKAMFPNIGTSIIDDDDVADVYNLGIYCQTFDLDWWNAPYKAENEDKEGYE